MTPRQLLREAFYVEPNRWARAFDDASRRSIGADRPQHPIVFNAEVPHGHGRLR